MAPVGNLPKDPYLDSRKELKGRLALADAALGQVLCASWLRSTSEGLFLEPTGSKGDRWVNSGTIMGEAWNRNLEQGT